MHAIDFVIGGGREGTDETSFSWIERVVSAFAASARPTRTRSGVEEDLVSEVVF